MNGLEKLFYAYMYQRLPCSGQPDEGRASTLLDMLSPGQTLSFGICVYLVQEECYDGRTSDTGGCTESCGQILLFIYISDGFVQEERLVKEELQTQVDLLSHLDKSYYSDISMIASFRRSV